MTDMTPDKATALRKPFPKESVGSLPKGGAMLDYVGHAAVTDRLLTVDPNWTWEPFAIGPDGLPAVVGGNLWIRLTVCGVTRIGVGDGKNAKECIGDAIRNAAMRFGVALDLWAKENLVEFAQAAKSSTLTTIHGTTLTPEEIQEGRDLLDALDAEVVAPMQPRTRGRLFALFCDHNITDPDEQRAGISHIIGRPLASRSELTEGEAQQVIKVLAARPKPAPVEATS